MSVPTNLIFFHNYFFRYINILLFFQNKGSFLVKKPHNLTKIIYFQQLVLLNNIIPNNTVINKTRPTQQILIKKQFKLFQFKNLFTYFYSTYLKNINLVLKLNNELYINKICNIINKPVAVNLLLLKKYIVNKKCINTINLTQLPARTLNYKLEIANHFNKLQVNRNNIEKLKIKHKRIYKIKKFKPRFFRNNKILNKYIFKKY